MIMFLTIVQLVLCLALVLVIMLQTGKTNGLSGAISGSSESFLLKSKNKSLDAKLSKATKWVGLAFVLLTLALNLIA